MMIPYDNVMIVMMIAIPLDAEDDDTVDVDDSDLFIAALGPSKPIYLPDFASTFCHTWAFRSLSEEDTEYYPSIALGVLACQRSGIKTSSP